MTTSDLKVLFYLKKNQVKKSGLSPIMGRITIGKTVSQFSLKLDGDAKLWNPKAGKMTGKTRLALDVNRQIDKTNLLIHTRYNELSRNQITLTASELKNALQGIGMEQDTLLVYIQEHNALFNERVGIDRSEATYTTYLYFYKHIQSFVYDIHKLSDISFKALNYAFIEQLVFYLQVDQKLKKGTIADILIIVRRMVKKAIQKGVIHKDPFFGFQLKREPTKHKTLNREELDAIMAVELTGENLNITRDMFVFAVFTGIAYIDVYNLTPDKIVTIENGSQWIISSRQKTGTSFKVRLMDIPLAIIEKYRNSTTNGKLFPVPERGVLHSALQSIKRKCGLKNGLSFHMGRHKKTYYQLSINLLRTQLHPIGNDLETSLVLRFT